MRALAMLRRYECERQGTDRVSSACGTMVRGLTIGPRSVLMRFMQLVLGDY